jgi:hypothetical protein
MLSRSLHLDIMKINPKPENSYVEETIYLKNGSPITRRAGIEQIISKLSKDKIRELIDEMDTYKKSLEGIELTEYEIYSKDISAIWFCGITRNSWLYNFMLM